MIYCVDTSTFLDAWVRWYPPDSFPSLWECIDQLIEEGRLLSSEEVLREIERKEDSLYIWAKERKAAFMPITNDVQTQVSGIMAQFPKLVDERTGKSFGDPFVIATAIVYSATVITGESRGTPNRPKIPIVCEHVGLTPIKLVELIQAEKWVF